MSNWYATDRERIYGPYSLDQMQELVRKGRVMGHALVRRGESGEWSRADTFTALGLAVVKPKPELDTALQAALELTAEQPKSDSSTKTEAERGEALEPRPKSDVVERLRRCEDWSRSAANWQVVFGIICGLILAALWFPCILVGVAVIGNAMFYYAISAGFGWAAESLQEQYRQTTILESISGKRRLLDCN